MVPVPKKAARDAVDETAILVRVASILHTRFLGK